MRILEKVVLDCPPDAAWRALHSPSAFHEIHGPLLRVEPMAAMPTRFEPGQDVPVRYAVGPAPLGSHLVSVAHRDAAETAGQVRIFRDWGVPLTGPLALLALWDHQMAVSPVPGDPGRTLWRERLVIAGWAAPLLWPPLWLLWQWRRTHLKRLARTWSHDPDSDRSDA